MWVRSSLYKSDHSTSFLTMCSNVQKVPNTTVRSRLLGKVLIQRFPSALPPLTILDCILDANWRDNGILHVLDVIKWKGQDISDCEASFRQAFLPLNTLFDSRLIQSSTHYRFWWRDTRLGELIQSTPPTVPVLQTSGQAYHFPYPVTLLPVPYHTDTTFATLQTHVIPVARSMRSVPVIIPASLPSAGPADSNAVAGGMDVDTSAGSKERPTLISVFANVAPDGLLLYISEASYEAGASPLSSWIPINTEAEESLSPMARPLDVFERYFYSERYDSSRTDYPRLLDWYISDCCAEAPM